MRSETERAADGEQQVAEQALGDLGRAFDELLHLLVEPREQRLHRVVRLEAAEHQRVEERGGRAPERPVWCRCLSGREATPAGTAIAASRGPWRGPRRRGCRSRPWEAERRRGSGKRDRL